MFFFSAYFFLGQFFFSAYFFSRPGKKGGPTRLFRESHGQDSLPQLTPEKRSKGKKDQSHQKDHPNLWNDQSQKIFKVECLPSTTNA